MKLYKHSKYPPSAEAFRRFRTSPYGAAKKMIQKQGEQMEHKSVAQYLAEKYDIKQEEDQNWQQAGRPKRKKEER